MNLRRILGGLIGFIIGFFPFINIFACAIYTFVRKKYRMGIILTISAVVQLVGIVIFIRDENKSQADISLFSEYLNRNTLSINIPATQSVNTIQLEAAMATASATAAKQFSTEKTEFAKFFDNLSKNTLTEREKKSFHEFVLKSHELYFNNLDTSAKVKNYNLSFNTLSANNREKMDEYAKDFVTDYLGEEVHQNNFLSFFIVLPFLFFWGFSVYLFRDIFEHNQSNTDPIASQMGNTNIFDNIQPVTDKEVPDIFGNTINNTPFTNTIPSTPKIDNANIFGNTQPVTDKEVSDIFDNTINNTPSSELKIVKINHITEDELSKLPGIGVVQAMSIMKDRQNNGFFTSMDNFKSRVSLSERVFDNLEDQLDFDVPDSPSVGGRGRVVEF